MKRLTTVETAKLIRATLKQAFPAVKFSVKSHSYSMGSSITVYWTDGPNVRQVNALIKRFEGAGFDGSTDVKYRLEACELNGEAFEFGVDFVSASRSISTDAMKQAALRVAFETDLPLIHV